MLLGALLAAVGLAAHAHAQLVAGGSYLSCVGAWNASSGAWAPVGSGESWANSQSPYTRDLVVRAFAEVDGLGLVVAGGFDRIGGTPTNHIAAWNGTRWTDLGGSSSMFVWPIQSIASYNGTLVAGEYSYVVDGIRKTGVGAWNGTAWAPLGDALVPAAVSTLTVHNGTLFATGVLVIDNPSTYMFGVATWNGSAWTWLNGPVGFNAGIFALTVLDSHSVVVGGIFTAVGGVSAQYVALWNGAAWSALGSGFEGWVYALVTLNGTLIAGGDFPGVASWNGSTWTTLGDGGLDQTTKALAVVGNTLYAGGSFRKAGNTTVKNMAVWDGVAWTTLAGGVSDPVTTLYVARTGDLLLLGGSFQDTFNLPDAVVGQYQPSPPGWTSFGRGLPATVLAATTWQGHLVTADVPTSTFGQLDRPVSVAAWTPSSGWATLGTAGMSDRVLALTSYQDRLVAGGAFVTAGGVVANHIAEWTGTAWASLNGGTNDQVAALTVYGGTLVAGGYFTTAGGVAASAIAQWDTELAAWAPVGTGLGGGVTVLTTFNGSLIAANLGVLRQWNGTVWSLLGTIDAGAVLAMTPFAGALVVGGTFQHVDATAAVDGVARWTAADGWTRVSARSSLGSAGAVTALAVTNGTLVVGGTFYDVTVDGATVPATFIARLSTAAAAVWEPLGATGAAIKVAQLNVLQAYCEPGSGLYGLACDPCDCAPGVVCNDGSGGSGCISPLPTTAAPTVPTPTVPTPTTAAPTVPTPTTGVPTTAAPTVPTPTTAAPTVSTPTTGVPTTAAPTVPTPTTGVPTTVAPAAPTTTAPTTTTPSTAAPTTTTPTTAAPSTAAPTTTTPSTAAPPTAQPTPVPTTPTPTSSAPPFFDADAPTAQATTVALAVVLPFAFLVAVALAGLLWHRRRQVKQAKLDQDYRSAAELNWVYAPSVPALASPESPEEPSPNAYYESTQGPRW